MGTTLGIQLAYNTKDEAETANYNLCESLVGSKGFANDSIFVTPVELDLETGNYRFCVYFDKVDMSSAQVSIR